MEDKTTHVFKELDRKDFTHTEALRAFRFWDVTHTENGGYTSNDYTVHIWEDGSLTISENDGGGFISLHGNSAKSFRKIISMD